MCSLFFTVPGEPLSSRPLPEEDETNEDVSSGNMMDDLQGINKKKLLATLN